MAPTAQDSMAHQAQHQGGGSTLRQRIPARSEDYGSDGNGLGDDLDAVVMSPTLSSHSRRQQGGGGLSEQQGSSYGNSGHSTTSNLHLPTPTRPTSASIQEEAPLDVKPAALQDETHPLQSPPPVYQDPRVSGEVNRDRSGLSPASLKPPLRSPRFAPETYEPSRRKREGSSTPMSGANTLSSGRDAYPPGYSPGPGTPSHGPRSGAPHTPIIALGRPALPDEPEFAELLTPAQMRRRRRPRAELAPDAPETMGAFAGRPLLAGPSRLGWTTQDGDLYRGAHSDPSAATPALKADHDDAITIQSASSGSSLWSWGSGGLPAAAGAVVRRLGDAINRRRGSNFSDSDSASGHSTSSSSSHGAASRIAGRLGRALTRTTSRATAASTEDRPRRVYVPRRREFTLVLPAEDNVWPPSGTTTPVHEKDNPINPSDRATPSTTANQVITTPVLPPLLEAIRAAREKVGIVYPQSEAAPVRKSKGGAKPDVPVRRGGSAPGRSRGAQRTFTAPPVPRSGPPVPTQPRQLSRVEMLRTGAGVPVRPKSASDLLGMTGPRSTSDSNLRAHTESHSGDDYSVPTEPTLPSPTPTLSDVTIAVPPPPKPPAAWWLDVSCPTWKDLRDTGEVLGLHPLTLEDVLHQDPREKVDIYDKLGYYFIVVRALDEQYFKYTPGSSSSQPGAPPGADLVGGDAAVHASHAHHGKKEHARRGWGFGRATGRVASKTGEKVEIVEDNPGKEGLEGVAVGGINLYLVVFADGIVSFHYDDVSKHTNRVRNRLLSAQPNEPTADWIAHGLLDSIVDAFFPLTGYVDGAVDDMDSLTIDPTQDPRKEEVICEVHESPSDTPYAAADQGDGEWIELETRHKTPRPQPKGKPSTFSTFRRKMSDGFTPLDSTNAKSPITLALLYLKLFFFPITSAKPQRHDKVQPDIYDRSTMLRSITNMRRLVTGLTRLLGGKNTVVVSLLKRAADNTRLGHASSDHEAYLSDVHDHILLLQTSLYHYEYILAHCQPAYLSYLNISSSFAKGGTDRLILALSTVTIGILPMQFIIGMFSINVNVPHNGGHNDEPPKEDGSLYPFNWFAGIMVAIFLVGCGIVLIIRYWRWTARKKWTRRRGGELPSAWNGFWGWE